MWMLVVQKRGMEEGYESRRTDSAKVQFIMKKDVITFANRLTVFIHYGKSDPSC